MKNINIWHSRIFQTDFIYKSDIKNVFKIPRIKGISLSACSKIVLINSKNILYLILAIKFVTNQNPAICKLRKSIPAFKLRKNMLIGSKVSLNSSTPRFENFLYMLVLSILPNYNLPKSNLIKVKSCNSISICIHDLSIFPQVNCWHESFPKRINAIINFKITSENLDSTKLLLSSLQIPF